MMSLRVSLIEVAYLAAALLFIVALKLMGDPRTARRGVFLAEGGMLLAIVGTLLKAEIVSYVWIAVGLAVGTTAGAIMAVWTPMTAMPQRTALSHAFGALAAMLVGVAEFAEHNGGPGLGTLKTSALGFEVMLGGLTFTGSLMAFAKLQGLLPGAPITYRGQNVANMTILSGLVALLIALVTWAAAPAALFYVMTAFALVFGVLLVLPIGAADMPVVIALLNSYAGLAGAATGFALNNKILIIAGALDGASGFILSILMCRAMNRSIANVLFGAFGQAKAKGRAVADGVAAPAGPVHSAAPEQAAGAVARAARVVIVPGYGMAVSQAQHAVKELCDVLSERGVDVKFAIHPVAGRMPGHMNVLLAEAGVPYDKLCEMDRINDEFRDVDIAIVIGANDVVNPAARTDPQSPIYGMPILNVDQARAVMVVKRSMAPGFAGIENQLFHRPNTTMIFGDARKTVQAFIAATRSSGAAAA